MANIRVNELERTITISATMNKKASVFGSDEYDLLRKAKKDNPTFKVVVAKRKPAKYKKLTKDFMMRFMNDLPDTYENKLNNLTFGEMIDGLHKKGNEKPEYKYGEITQWFVDKYPDYDDYSPIDAVAARAKATLDAETISATI